MELFEKTKEFEKKHGSPVLSALIMKSFRESLTKDEEFFDVLMQEIEEHEKES